MEDAFAADAYVIEQLIRPVVNLYRVSALLPSGEPGRPVAFVRQKRFALKEDIRFFADEDESEELFRIKARRMIDVLARYDVAAADGSAIGTLAKVFGRSLFRSTWRLLDPEERELAVAQEKNMAIALLRRVQDTIPLPYHFDIDANGRRLGEVRRQFSLRDKYTLDLSGDRERTIDRRLAIALGVGLDALQQR
ncbi:MAG TPA: hypothetical protein VE615_05805 [Gaiellaceae bacterium]|nr:hypothetical protein [Gaiellaceae bacterium]